ncbi:hypothetical protein KY389_11385 [Paracoccus bogoriensis]|uniref:hypothetical protein n=1 Tax=Paracoccus bogoriensis TaxID=242065 RepID=UPI001CA51964|nr:hypothetical protein [Paracoccus bogoriensis]MBW7057287.1 hypothetical protein [Paracoccus bogoriensis]
MRSQIEYRGASIMLTDMPGPLFAWTHDATDGHGTAATLLQAKIQIDAHLRRVTPPPLPLPGTTLRGLDCPAHNPRADAAREALDTLGDICRTARPDASKVTR